MTLFTGNGIIEQLPRGRGYLADQFQRAALSVPLNIAEGAGEFSSTEKSRFYRMARRSATECAGIFDVCFRLELTDEDSHQRGRALILRIVARRNHMLIFKLFVYKNCIQKIPCE